MTAKKRLFASQKSDQHLKITFPSEFCNEMWLKIRRFDYNYIAEIKVQKFYSGTILGANQIFPHPQTLIYLIFSRKQAQ